MPYTPPGSSPQPTFLLPNNQPVDQSCIRPWPQDSTQVNVTVGLTNVNHLSQQSSSQSQPKLRIFTSNSIPSQSFNSSSSSSSSSPNVIYSSPISPCSTTFSLKNSNRPKSIQLPSRIITDPDILFNGSKSTLNSNGIAQDHITNTHLLLSNGSTLPDPPNTTDRIMIRKKSGEIVRSSLKKNGMSNRAKSAPTTPTCPKFVHFDSQLEHVRLFLQAETPQAVSANVSPIDEKTDEEDYFGIGSKSNLPAPIALSLPNFPSLVTPRQASPVFVEYITLSDDKKQIQGSINVQNLAFQKWVAVRFTFDFWQTVSEVSAEFKEPIPNSHSDRFKFRIKLQDMLANIDKRTMYMAVRYNVDGKEFWDNNNGMNYQVEFRRVKDNNKHRRSQTITSDTWPLKQKNFAEMEDLKKVLDKFHEEEYGSPLNIKTKISSTHMNFHHPTKRRSSVQKSFSLGIGKSHSEDNIHAISQLQKSSKETQEKTEQPQQQIHRKNHRPDSPTIQVNPYINDPLLSDYYHTSHEHYISSFLEGLPSSTPSHSISQEPISQKRSQSPKLKSSPKSNPISIPTGGSRPAINSSSYHDFVDRYCFYNGSTISSPRNSRPSSNGYPSNSYASSPPAAAIRG